MMTMNEMRALMESLSAIYTDVRLLDEEAVNAVCEGAYTASSGGACYACEHKRHFSRRCAAKLALSSGEKQCRIEVCGADMLRRLADFEQEPLLQTAHEIARWHHERWDGRGYPDGLKGSEISISAQIVSLADVYEALTSERCYREAYSHEQAMQMILSGECGAFNPLLLRCLTDVQSELRAALHP